jgi:hypothetical protein
MKTSTKVACSKIVFGNLIIEMHCVGHFILLMITRMFLLKSVRSCVVFFVITIHFNFKLKTQARKHLILYKSVDGVIAL